MNPVANHRYLQNISFAYFNHMHYNKAATGSPTISCTSFGLRGPQSDDDLRHLLQTLTADQDVLKVICIVRSGQRMLLVLEGAGAERVSRAEGRACDLCWLAHRQRCGEGVERADRVTEQNWDALLITGADPPAYCTCKLFIQVPFLPAMAYTCCILLCLLSNLACIEIRRRPNS